MIPKLLIPTLLITLSALAVSALGFADDNVTFRAQDSKWREECSACHLAYPPGLLDGSEWRTIMSGLAEHFGTDASLDAPKKAHIERFLVTNAHNTKPIKPDGTPRITTLPWFRKEHLEEVPTYIWQSDDVRNGVNCEACHRNAAAGDFSENSLRIPVVVKGGAK